MKKLIPSDTLARFAIICASIFAVLPVVPAMAEGGRMSPFASADIAVLGEVHDNAAHHREQARIVAAMDPAALVFEMLTPQQVQAADGVDRRDTAALAAAFDWANSGWPDFAMYAPIFEAAPDAYLYGAGVPRDVARAAFTGGITNSFGDMAAVYGLTTELPPQQMQARLELQYQAHCQAIPHEKLAPMVALQRLRDAHLARAALQALMDTGGPVAVITGNGHARSDWGATALIRAVDPVVHVVALGQSEAGVRPDGGFDLIIDSVAVERGDPCDVFR